MKQVTTLCVATVFSCAVAATAQTPQAGQTQQTETQRQGTSTSGQTGQRETTPAPQAQGRAGTSTFVGCVEKGSTANAFVLNVLEVPAATAGAQPQARAGQGNAQATGTAGSSMVGQRIELIGGNNVGAHLGHKVEISGMVTPQGNATGRPGLTGAATTRVNVSNLRMIDAKCEPAAATRGGAGASGTSGTRTSEPAPAPGTQKSQPDQQETPGQRQY